MLSHNAVFRFLSDESAASGVEASLVTLMSLSVASMVAPIVRDSVSSLPSYVGCQISAYVEGGSASCGGAVAQAPTPASPVTPTPVTPTPVTPTPVTPTPVTPTPVTPTPVTPTPVTPTPVTPPVTPVTPPVTPVLPQIIPPVTPVTPVAPPVNCNPSAPQPVCNG